MPLGALLPSRITPLRDGPLKARVWISSRRASTSYEGRGRVRARMAPGAVSGTGSAAGNVVREAARIVASDPTLTPREVATALVGRAIPDTLTGLDPGTPNLLLEPTSTTGKPPTTTTTGGPPTTSTSGITAVHLDDDCAADHDDGPATDHHDHGTTPSTSTTIVPPTTTTVEPETVAGASLPAGST